MESGLGFVGGVACGGVGQVRNADDAGLLSCVRGGNGGNMGRAKRVVVVASVQSGDGDGGRKGTGARSFNYDGGSGGGGLGRMRRGGKEFDGNAAVDSVNAALEQGTLEAPRVARESNAAKLERFGKMDSEARMTAPDVELDAELYKARIGKKLREIQSFPGLVRSMSDGDRLQLSAELGLKFNSKVRVVVEAFNETGVKVAVTVPKQLEARALKRKHLPFGKWLAGQVTDDDLNSVPTPLWPGDETIGFVRMVRKDGTLDISLFPLNSVSQTDAAVSSFGDRHDAAENQQPAGYVEPKDRVREELRANNGFLPLNDSSEPEQVRNLLLMSSNTFKVTLGAMLRDGEITITSDGVRATSGLAPAALELDPAAAARAAIWDEADQMPIEEGTAGRSTTGASRYEVQSDRAFFKKRYNAEQGMFEELELVETLRKDDRSPSRRTDDPPNMRVHRRYTNHDFKLVD